MQQDGSIMTTHTTQVSLPYKNSRIGLLFQSDVYKVDYYYFTKFAIRILLSPFHPIYKYPSELQATPQT